MPAPDRLVPPQRILIHAINFAPEMIGCGKYTTELARFLKSRGHGVEVITAPPHYPGWSVPAPYAALRYARETLDGIKIIRCPMLMRANGGGLWRLLAPLTFALAAAPVVMWRVWRSRPDVVFCVEPTLFSAPAALLAAKLVGARAVLHVQDLEVDAAFAMGHVRGGWIRRLAHKVEAAVLGGFDRIITISGKMREALIAKNLPPKKIELLRNWVEMHKPTPAQSAYRDELGIDPSRFVVLYSGHIGAKQALHELLLAARLMLDRPDILFVIAGEGPLKDKLMTSSRDLANIQFLPLQPAARLQDFLAMADLHVLPQDKGAADLVLPSKLGGMLASGRPVLAMADSGTELADMLEGAAVLVPAGDYEGLASALRAAVGTDLSALVRNGLALAGEMSAQRILPLFEAALLAGSENREADPAAQSADVSLAQ
jgi:colanic acid biosynthesis glycosyl transferase WcaI